jgi:ubiquinone/menaquinone biosynthesis C-methylase UbiE
MSHISPSRLIQIATGHWASQILACAVEYEVFTHLSRGPATAAELAERACISERGAQALLDGLLGMELVMRDGSAYANGPEADAFLVQGRPVYLGFAGMAGLDWEFWSDLKPAIKRGGTPQDTTAYEIQDFVFWEKLVAAIAPLAVPVAEAAADRLAVAAAGPIQVLDVGGGSGIYSARWLTRNPEARATQLDWPNINQLALKAAKRLGFADRFQAIDGNLLELDYGDGRYDHGIFSHMAHGLSEEQNQAVLAKLRRALKLGGTLVMADFVLDDQRNGHPMALLFYANMLHSTQAGRTYTESEYRSWLSGAGFQTVEFQAIEPTPVTVVYAS